MNRPYEEHRDAAFKAELYLKKMVTGNEVLCGSPQDIYRRLKDAREVIEKIEITGELP